MHINEKVLCLPPFLSTTWGNISALHIKGTLLVISLTNGDTVNVPNLSVDQLEKIFTAHSQHLEQGIETPQHQTAPPKAKPTPPPFLSNLTGGDTVDMPFRLGFGTLDGLGNMMQHNPDQAHAPDLPEEIVGKIGAIAKIISPDEIVGVPKPEPHCNCMFCQIARTIHGNSPDEEASQELEDNGDFNPDEEVSDHDLQFCQWEIAQTGENLYNVSNRLDDQEKYSVYLGHPVGCTCGKEGCEHILAVLQS